MAQKRSHYIPAGSNPLQEKFINCLMKQGKKNLARRIFKESMDILVAKGQKTPDKIFEKAIETVKPTLEIKAKRIGGAVYQIPIEVKPGRQLMLAFRWLLDATRSKKGSPVANRLAEELLNASNGEGNAMKKKDDMMKMAAANKAFAHYAKY